MRSAFMATALALGVFLAGCGDDDDGADDAGTGGDGGPPSLVINGNYDGDITDVATLKTAVFNCPWEMPPPYMGVGTVDPATGDVHGVLAEIEAGTWCMMSSIDMNPDDGVAAVDGLDPVNATGDENEHGALEISIVDGQTTTVELVFAL